MDVILIMINKLITAMEITYKYETIIEAIFTLDKRLIR